MKMPLKFACFLFALLFFGNIGARGENANFYLKNGDRVVFYGDSITEQAFYTNFVETYALTRFPKLKIDFTNSGWSGDRIYGGGGGTADERVRRDVLPYQPTVLTAMFGMNDGCYVEFNADCDKGFTEGYGRLLDLLKKNLPGLRVTLLQPSPFDDWTNANAWRLAPPVKGGYNNVLIRYGEFVKNLARKNNLNVSDMNAPLVEAIQRARKIDEDQAQKIIPDRIHPSSAGGLLMANELLKLWNAPALVTAIEIDAANKKIAREENAKISDFKKSGEEIFWTQADESLPLPIDAGDKTTAFVLSISNVVENLNREILKVNNLSAANYTLKIDGAEIGKFTKQALANGINLANFQTPMMKQAMAVYKLTEQHNRIHFTRWREIQVPFEKENLTDAPKVLSALDASEAELVKRQRAAAQPKIHQYQLIAAG